MALRDAATEFGARLGHIPEDESVEWEGPLAERMFEPLRLSRKECREWPEVAALTRQLPDVLRDAAQAVGGSERLDFVVVGGVGAMWPFAAEVAAKRARVWQSGFPLEDVARGAACWPEAGAPNLSMLPLDGSPSGVGLPLSAPESSFSSASITLDMSALSAPAVSVETLEMIYEESVKEETYFSEVLPIIAEVEPEEDPAEALDETDDEMPPSQRWRLNNTSTDI